MQLIKNRKIPAIDLMIMAGLFLVSLVVWGQNVHYGHAYMLVIVAICALSMLAQNIWLSAIGLYLAVWYTWIFAASTRGLIPDEAIIQSLDSMTFIMAGLLVYVSVRLGSAGAESYKNAICVLSCILAAIGAVQYFYGNKIAFATLGNPNFLAAFLAISMPFFYRKKWWMAIPLIAATLLMTHTSMAIGACLIGTGLYFFGWKGALAGVVPGIAYFALFKTPASFLDRWNYWTDAIQKISNSWQTVLFGVGPGIYWQPGNQLHSEYVYLLFNLGLVGIVLAGAYIYNTIKIIPDRQIFASFSIILIDGFGNHLFHTAPTAMLAIIIFALMNRDAANTGRNQTT